MHFRVVGEEGVMMWRNNMKAQFFVYLIRFTARLYFALMVTFRTEGGHNKICTIAGSPPRTIRVCGEEQTPGGTDRANQVGQAPAVATDRAQGAFSTMFLH